ncbi:MAG: site-specific DNA-methyltransferase [Clostridiales bacterium]|jgi:site-specific DNA-methyltransferase (adenine-specific)|nr:site-specific DNA-methyltransferase [Clostridiales bacterium]
MKRKKSPRNKTIDIGIEEGRQYLERCIKVSRPVQIDEVINKTIAGDMFQVVPCLPEKSVDLIIADPPYNLTKQYHGRTFQKKNMDEYRSYTERWLHLVLPLLKDTGSIYICCDWQSSLVIGQVLMDRLIVRNRITWQREKGRGAKANWKNSMEDIWYATVSDEYTFNLKDVMMRRKVIAPYREKGKPKDWIETSKGNYRDTCPSNFWDDISIPFWSMPENTAHPTQKPEKLIAKLILASSRPGELVFDPFLGSGTTSVVAKKLGRKYIGIELNELYCVWAEKRLEMAEEDSSIQGYTDGVFWERNTLAEQLAVADSENE